VDESNIDPRWQLWEWSGYRYVVGIEVPSCNCYLRGRDEFGGAGFFKKSAGQEWRCMLSIHFAAIRQLPVGWFMMMMGIEKKGQLSAGCRGYPYHEGIL